MACSPCVIPCINLCVCLFVCARVCVCVCVCASRSAKLPKMLAAMCCCSAVGHSLVLQAMDAVKQHRRDKQRFKVSVRARVCVCVIAANIRVVGIGEVAGR